MSKAGTAEDLDFPDDAPGAAGGLPDPEVLTPTAVAAEDDVEVEIVDDTPAKDRGIPVVEREVVEPTEEELKSYSENVQKRIKDLTHARHNERRMREQSERQQQEMQRVTSQLLEENRRLRGFVDTGSKQFIETSSTLAEREVATAQAELRAAQEAFDPDAIVKAQDALMDAKLKLREVKNMRPTALQEEKPVVQPAARESVDDQIDERTLHWQQNNRWFGRPGSEEPTAFALAVHQKLINQGYDPRSEAYFEHIDARMKGKFPELYGSPEQARETAPTQTPRARPTSVVAPATRSSSPRKVTLNASQLAIAERLGLTPQQYAAELVKTQKEI